jgi:DNA topoisomerase-1
MASHDQKYHEQGIGRKKTKTGFRYYYIKTDLDISKNDEERIKQLKIPPAWTDVWVAIDPHSSIQAIGYDDKGRRQYRYHQVHIEKAAKDKFLRMQNFIQKMGILEKNLEKHSKFPPYDKNRVIALMLNLVKDHNIRVGKEQYARENKSYGVSSLRQKHVKEGHHILVFKFKGKSNQKLQYTINNPDHVNEIRELLKLSDDPNDKVFQFIMHDGRGVKKIYGVTDKDLNQYLKIYMGKSFTVKDFRTYGANYYFIKTLLNETNRHLPRNQKIAKRNIKSAVTSVRYHLKHTPSISKKSYIMAFAVELYLNNPEFFMELRKEDPLKVLQRLLKLYQETIM